jgi:hypothetical protein
MNMKLPLIVSIAAFALLRSTALSADTRFDGIWVGTENVNGQEFRGGSRVSAAVEKSAKIAIAQGGTLLAIVEGYGPGRYMDIQHTKNTIIFRAGQRVGQLSLSADGQTLFEKGVIPGFILMNIYQREGALSGHQRTLQSHDIPGLEKSTAGVTGTFHRQR